MHDEARRLHDDDDMGVLMHDLEGNVLADGAHGLGFGHRNLYGLARFDPHASVTYGPARSFDDALADEPLHAGSAQAREGVGEKLVEA